jgi:uncharacterized repeat protein (TIGR03803 family)
MQGKRRLMLFAAVLTVVFGCLTVVTPLFADSKEQVLYSFNDNGTDGYNPDAGLIFDAVGNLYGTTPIGGANADGVIFELTPGINGTWTETVLYPFCSVSGCTDGQYPIAGLILDAAGNLYGTTVNGGTHDRGTVFQLSPGANGTWTETVLYSFNNNHKDGRDPEAGLIFDASGNLYGTTLLGGAYGYGTVFQLTPGGNGTWTETLLHSFQNNTRDGIYPYAGLIFDPAGNLYGTANGGGEHGEGAVLQLVPGTNGKWKERILHSFNGKDGLEPYSGLIFDVAGNLYGTTHSGGASGTGCGGYGCGTVFELTPGANGKWTEKVLHSFNDNGKDGYGPYAGLTFDAAGDLYGTAYYGGAYGSQCGGSGCGIVFQLTPATNGKWTEKVLHSFGNVSDGAGPYAPGLIFDAAGNLYGTTAWGGAYDYGTVFEITP